jgi:hypothetical protein
MIYWDRELKLTYIRWLVGGEYITLPMKDITTERLRTNMTSMFEAAFCTPFLQPTL